MEALFPESQSALKFSWSGNEKRGAGRGPLLSVRPLRRRMSSGRNFSFGPLFMLPPPFPTLRVPPLLWLRRRRCWRRAPSSCPSLVPPESRLNKMPFEAVPWRIFAHYSSAVEGCLFSPGLPFLLPPLFPFACRQNRHLPFLLLLLAVRLFRLLFVSLPFPPPLSLPLPSR